MNANMSNPSLNTLDPSNMLYGTGTTPNHTGMGNEWMTDPAGWGLPTMDFSPKAPVPQSLLSFSGESMTSGDDLLFSASSVNGSNPSASSSNNGSNASESLVLDGKGQTGKGKDSAYQGIAIPNDDMDGFEFADYEA